MTTTPTQSAPQEVPQWAKDALIELRQSGLIRCDDVYWSLNKEMLARIITKHAAALSEELELQAARVIEREERLEQMAASWDATKAQLTTLRLWSEQAREAMADAERYLVEHGCSHEYPVLINLRLLLAAHPAQGMEGRG